MAVLAWVILAYVVAIFVGLAAMWSWLLRRQRDRLSSNDRLIVRARIVELILQALLFAGALLIHSWWPIVAFVFLAILMTLLRRALLRAWIKRAI